MSYFEDVAKEMSKSDRLRIEVPNITSFAHDMEHFAEMSGIMAEMRNSMFEMLEEFNDLNLMGVAHDGGRLVLWIMELYAKAGIDFDCVWEVVGTRSLDWSSLREIIESGRKMSEVVK